MKTLSCLFFLIIPLFTFAKTMNDLASEPIDQKLKAIYSDVCFDSSLQKKKPATVSMSEASTCAYCDKPVSSEQLQALSKEIKEIKLPSDLVLRQEQVEREVNFFKNYAKDFSCDLVNSTSSNEEKLAAYNVCARGNINYIPKTERKGFQECGMSVAEIVSMAAYTEGGYEGLNKALRKKNPPESQGYRHFQETLIQALGKLKPYEGYVARSGSLPPDILDQHQVGAIVSYQAFTSASLGKRSGGHTFIIKSKTGRFIGSYSYYPDEYEVLFKSGTKFKVLSREKKSDGNFEFVMEEVD